MGDDFIIMDIPADVTEGLAGHARPAGTKAELEGVAAEGLVGRRVPEVLQKLKIETTSVAKDARDAARDPRKLVSRNMPVGLIAPCQDTDASGILADSDPIADARSQKIAWGVTEVLGPRPLDVTGAGVTVAVLDTGIDIDHPAFAAVKGTICAESFVGDRTLTADGNGHGTHCAGTIFGRAVDGVRIGVAPGVTDVLIGKVLDDKGGGSTKSVLDGLKWAHSNGANVVSLSLGFDFTALQRKLMEEGRPPELATSITLKAYRDNLRQFEILANLLMLETEDSSGMVIVAAAGNESRRNQDQDFVIDAGIPAAAARDILSVGAAGLGADARLFVAPFSNTNPVVAGPGVGIVSANAGGGSQTPFKALNGTSMACPHVAAVAALWWQARASRTGGAVAAADVRAQLRATARDDRFEERWSVFDRGSGVVTAPQARSGRGASIAVSAR